MSEKPIRILCLFDYACTTGFSTVSHNIILHLKKHFRERLRLTIVAINYYGDPFKEDEYTQVFSAAKIDPMGDVYGRNEFMRIARYVDYEVIFIIQDIAILNMLGQLYKLIKSDRKKENMKLPKLIAYFPVDSPPLSGFHTHLDVFDTLVTYTEYGRNELTKKRPAWKTKIKVIPHGINPAVLYPLESKTMLKFRKDYFGKNADKFIISNINRNQPRKDIPTTIFSFIEYKKQFNPKSFLYLHMSYCDPLGWKLKDIMEQTDLIEGEDYMFLAEEIKDHQAGPEMMNYIFNSSDLYLTTALGEGWGLGITDSFACKLPVVAPLHTSIKEISNDGERLWGCEEFRPIVTTWDNVIRDHVDYREVAEKINECNINLEETKKKTEAAYLYVQNLSWEKICERWVHEFESLIK